MYKLLGIFGITIIIWIISIFMYPPYADKKEEMKLNPELTKISDIGIDIREFKRLKYSKNGYTSQFKVRYKPTCEIEIYDKFATKKTTKKAMERYLRVVSVAESARDVDIAQRKFLKEIKYSDQILNDIFLKNISNKKTFIQSLQKRAYCKENQ